MTVFRAALWFGVLVGAVACSGSSDDNGGSGGRSNAGRGGATGGSSAGGSGGSGGTGGVVAAGSGGNGGSAITGGTGGTGGATGGTGGGVTGGAGGTTAGIAGSGVAGSGLCCNAFPTCGLGELEVPTQADCAQIPMCHAVTLCCSTIYCRVLTPGSGGSSGSGGSGGDGGAPAECDPETEHDREYIGASPTACAVIFYGCPEHTTMFSNDCGCGCEQDASCPEFVDCMPGGDPNPGCSSEERARCPYTDIAF
jgi:hypothetical protein